MKRKYLSWLFEKHQYGCRPRWAHVHCYHIPQQCCRVTILFPFHWPVIWAWRLNGVWCQYRRKNSWIDLKILHEGHQIWMVARLDSSNGIWNPNKLKGKKMDTRTGLIHEIPEGGMEELKRQLNADEGDLVKLSRVPTAECTKCRGTGRVRAGQRSKRWRPCKCCA